MIPLIDMVRSVPEVAVRLWCGATVHQVGDTTRIVYEGRALDVPPEIYFEAEKVKRILQVRPRMLRLVQDVLEIRHDAEDIFIQMLFSKTGLPKVLFVPAGQSASGYYRAMIPSDMMREAGEVISHFTLNVDITKALRYDVLWIQLVTSPILLEIVRKVKESGVRVVYDIDDRLDAIPAENQAKNVYGTPEKQAEIHEMIRLADVVTVSTEPLARSIDAIGARRTVVLPNSTIANVAPRRHPPNPAHVRILWAGSPTHKRDLAIVAPALRSILKKYSGKVRFTCFGERLPEALSDCYEWIDLKDPVDFEMYHDTLASVAADFGIAPLEANTFNESKSAIKALEYAAAGYPMLLSPVGEYPDVVRAGLPAELVADVDWEAALERMIARTREEREVMGQACVAWVCANRCMGRSHARDWAEVVQSLVPKESEVSASSGVGG